MAFEHELYEIPLDRAVEHSKKWLASVRDRSVGPTLHIDELAPRFSGGLPETGTSPAEVIDELAARSEDGLMAMGSGRFFGWVVGGTLPAALAADWLVSAWDQNAPLRFATPAVVAVEEAAARWLLELFALPPDAGVGFTTGATMAHFTALASARRTVLARRGWDEARDGLTGAPRIAVLVGEERHDTVDLALRYLGLGAPSAVAVDDQGRILPSALAEALAGLADDQPAIVCLQAGNLHSGAFDPFAESIALAHERGAWVHVDGAFGLWASTVPSLRHLTAGIEGADSWSSDAHKTLNVPYDCGIAIVANALAQRAALGAHADYLISDDRGPGDPLERVPEFSRRARGVTVWAALRSLGRSGVASMVATLAQRAGDLATGIADIEGASILNDVAFTQVCVAFESDETTRAVTEWLMNEGTVWMSGSRWRGRDVLRISVSNWATDEDDVARSVDAVRRAVAAVT